MKYQDIAGTRSGRLVAVSYSHKSKHNGHLWNCLCDCGNTSVVGESQIKGGHILSCGCLRRDRSTQSAKHGMSNSHIYLRWKSMKQRCNNPSVVNFDIYGGRGITYDPRWEDFRNFYEDMNDGFREHLELDRIDVNGNYCKENCRWVTHNENNYNKTRQSNNSSGKTGVNFRKDTGKYRAYIHVEGKCKCLGSFETIEEAIEVRKNAEMYYYGYGRE